MWSSCSCRRTTPGSRGRYIAAVGDSPSDQRAPRVHPPREVRQHRVAGARPEPELPLPGESAAREARREHHGEACAAGRQGRAPETGVSGEGRERRWPERMPRHHPHEDGGPIEGASVLLVAQNGTANQGKTGPDGVAEMPARVRRKVAVFVAHPQHRAAFYRQHDNGAKLEVTLPAGAGAHSLIFAGNTGHIPGFGPRLAPIGNNHDAEGIPPVTYMYLDNGSVDGRAEQPFHFRVGRPMMLENGEGDQLRATCVGFVGEARCGSTKRPDHHSMTT